MSEVHGRYGFMLQVPEGVVQQAIDAFSAANPDKFRVTAHPEASLPKYGIREQFALEAELLSPKVKFIAGRAIQLSFNIATRAHMATRFEALPGGAEPPPAPDIDAQVNGSVVIEVEGLYRTVGSESYLALNLRQFSITSFDVTVDSATVVFSNRSKAVMSALARRQIIYTLSNRVVEIPASFQIKPSIPFIGGITLSFDYKVVSSGDQRALALLCQVSGMPADWNAVSYGLSQSNDVGIFLDLGLINRALDAIEVFLEDITLEKQPDPTNPKRHGTFTINDARFHVERGKIVIDNVELHVQVLDTIQREVRKVVCFLLGGACGVPVCEETLEWVMEEVLQFDQVGHVTGWVSPRVENRRLMIDTDLDIDLANWVWFALPVLMGGILPGGMLITPILMIIGDMLIDRAVNHALQEASIDTLIKKEIPGAHLEAIAYAREVAWPDNCLALMAQIELKPV